MTDARSTRILENNVYETKPLNSFQCTSATNHRFRAAKHNKGDHQHVRQIHD